MDTIGDTNLINFYIDMSDDDVVGAWSRGTFKIAGAYKGAGITCYVTTVEGYTVFLDNQAQTGTITMPQGTFKIDDTEPDELAAEPERMLRQLARREDDQLVWSKQDWRRLNDERLQEVMEDGSPPIAHHLRKLEERHGMM